MDKQRLYDLISEALAKGKNVEISKKPDGSWKIVTITRKNIDT